MTQTTSHTMPMLEAPVGRTLWNMTVPMILGMVMLMTFGLVDTFFVSLIGTNELAAISFTFPVTFTVISLNIGLGIGTSAVVGKLLGANENLTARSVATAALMTVSLLVGLLCLFGAFTIEPIFRLLGATDPNVIALISEYMTVWYVAGILLALPMVGNSVLRAAGDTKTPSIIMAAGGAINAILDPFLIFGIGPFPAMGIQGAAIATAIAWGTGVVWILWLLNKRNLMLPRLLSLSEFITHSKDVLKIGFPAAGANMLTPVATGVITAIVATYGASAVAAWGVGGRLESIASIVMLALSMSLPPLLSQNFGANKLDRVLEAYHFSLKLVLAIQLVMFGVLFIVAPYIAQAFATEADVMATIVLFLTIVPLGYGMQGVVVLTNSALNAIHKPMSALLLNGVRLFIFFVPFAYFGSMYFQLNGLFWGLVFANLCMAAISYISFRRTLSRLTLNDQSL